MLSLLNTHRRSLNDESSSKLLTETKAILNSKPLTVGYVYSEQTLCPSNILTVKSKVVLPPPAEFVKTEDFTEEDGGTSNILQITFELDDARKSSGLFSLVQNET